jgi:hypothetical protein
MQDDSMPRQNLASTALALSGGSRGQDLEGNQDSEVRDQRIVSAWPAKEFAWQTACPHGEQFAPKGRPFSQPKATPWEHFVHGFGMAAQRAPPSRLFERLARWAGQTTDGNSGSQGDALGWKNRRAFGPSEWLHCCSDVLDAMPSAIVGMFLQKNDDMVALRGPTAHHTDNGNTLNTQNTGATSNLRPRTLRQRPRGILLIEVLIAIFVLLFGLLAVATLVIVGGMALSEVERMDRTAACGRAALHDIKIRGLLDWTKLWDTTTSAALSSTPTSPFVIDPLGLTNGTAASTSIAGAGIVPRYNLQTYSSSGIPLTSTTAEQIFRSQDDLVFVLPEDDTSKSRPAGTRPFALMDTTGTTQQYNGETSWFLTVAPTSATNVYNVAVVVCYGRTIGQSDSEVSYTATFVNNIQYGSGAISVPGDVKVASGDWILLCSSTQVTWYRVVYAGYDATNNKTMFQLVGPDWAGGAATAVIVDGVSNVYTATMTVN